jgi:outer membrane protein with beta-barrel domain
VRDLKNIDRVFQENLKDLEVSPPNKLWNTIEERLHPVSKKRKTPIWFKISSIAALFILFFSVGTIYFLPSSSITRNIIPENKKQQNELQDKDVSKKTTPTNSIEQNPLVVDAIKETNEKSALGNSSILSNEISRDVAIEDEKTDNKVLNKFYLADTKNLPFTNTNNKKVSKKEITNSKFTVATIFAPIYINSFGDGSGIDPQFVDNSTSGNSSFSYGVKIAYKLNNKFSVQSGINLINLGYTTNDIYITPGVSIVGFSNLSSSPILSKGETKFSKENDNSGSLNQIFGYVEIPVEIKYNMVNGKLGVNLVGGFSTLLLNKDEVFVETNSFTQSLGASNNLRSINFSGNIGLDVDYSIRRNLYINISPMFKVQTNTFSKNSGSIQPYYLGVYTGLNYKF